MDIFDLNQLTAEADGEWSRQRYVEFLRAPSLSLGIYRLPAGGVDTQKPHTEDEVYYVVSDNAAIRVREETQPVKAGSLVFVPALAEHRFFDIAEDLVLLVFFAPAEYSRSADSGDSE